MAYRPPSKLKLLVWRKMYRFRCNQVQVERHFDFPEKWEVTFRPCKRWKGHEGLHLSRDRQLWDDNGVS